MPIIYVFGMFAVGAYVLQGILGFKQIKHFAAVYAEMKALGRVAIGRKAGKFRAGTIVMLAIDSEGMIVDSRKIQGTTVMAKFKPLANVTGLKIDHLTVTSACVAKENRLTQQTIMDAVSVYQRVTNGEVIEENQGSIYSIKEQFKLFGRLLQMKIKRSVNK